MIPKTTPPEPEVNDGGIDGGSDGGGNGGTPGGDGDGGGGDGGNGGGGGAGATKSVAVTPVATCTEPAAATTTPSSVVSSIADLDTSAVAANVIVAAADDAVAVVPSGAVSGMLMTTSTLTLPAVDVCSSRKQSGAWQPRLWWSELVSEALIQGVDTNVEKS